MTKILLLRHGEAKNIDGDVVLTEKGVAEAKALADKLLTMKINKIYSSDLTRAKETMNYYLNKLEVKPEIFITEQLREIYRVVVGGPVREGTPEDREENDKRRADEIYKELLKEEGTIAVFTHGNIIRYLLVKAMDVQYKDIWTKMFLSNGSISIIEKTKECLVCVDAINLIDHLPETKTFYEEELRTVYNE